MCNPAAAMATVQIAQTLAQNQANRKMARAETTAAGQAYGAESTQLQLQALQTAQQSRQEISQRTREALVERARLRTAAGESGAVGSSLDRVVASPGTQAGLDVATMVGNREANLQQIQAGQGAAYARYKSRLNAIQMPSPLMTGLQIAGTGLDYYTRTHTPKGK